MLEQGIVGVYTSPGTNFIHFQTNNLGKVWTLSYHPDVGFIVPHLFSYKDGFGIK